MKLLLAFLRWLCYTPKRRSLNLDCTHNRFSISFQLRPRWWLPFFWLMFLLSLPLYLLDGGVLGWWQDLRREFNPMKRVSYTRGGTWDDYAPEWRRRLELWHTLYTA
jgi:hypothetical protein